MDFLAFKYLNRLDHPMTTPSTPSNPSNHPMPTPSSMSPMAILSVTPFKPSYTLQIIDDQGESISVDRDGSIYWRGRKVETDAVFQGAVLTIITAIRDQMQAKEDPQPKSVAPHNR